jgi:hypothetical protein
MVIFNSYFDITRGYFPWQCRTPQDSSLPELKERRGAGAMASTGALRPPLRRGIGSSEGALRKATGDVVNKKG